MKKLFLLMIIVIMVITSVSFSMASEQTEWEEDNKEVISTATETSTKQENNDEAKEVNSENIPDTTGLDGASEQVVGALTKKEKRINELTKKYDDRTLGTIAYWLEVARFYSTPIFFIFLTIGAFNFFIIGNKKLDKKEQGFGWMTACIIGWVVFQCIPLLFTVLTLGFKG